MCSVCSKEYPDFDLEHSEQFCPFRNSRYCSYCACYGHLTRSYPATPARMFREPCYEEQLILPSERIEKNITSKTWIPTQEKDNERRILHIQEDNKTIAAYLHTHAFKIPKGFTKKQALEEYAKQQNQRIVYFV